MVSEDRADTFKPPHAHHPLTIFFPQQIKKAPLRSPSEGTEHTAPVTPSSLLQSPVNDALWNGVSPMGCVPEDNTYDADEHRTYSAGGPTDIPSTQRDRNSVKMLHQHVTSPNSIVLRPVLTETTSEIAAVTPQTIASFQKLKLQANIAERAAKQRKRKVKVADRYEQVKGYRALWNEYKEIQEQVLYNSLTQEDTESISFLKQPESWYIDFNVVHHQQKEHHQQVSPDQSNFSLLSEETMQAQRKFYEEKKQRTRAGATPRSENGSSINSNVGRGLTDSNGYGPIRTLTTAGNAISPLYEQQNDAMAHSPLAPLSMDSASTPVLEMDSVENGVIRWRQFENSSTATGDSARRLDFPIGDALGKRSKGAAKSSFKTPSAGQRVNPFWDMSTEQFLMMSSPSFGGPISDEHEEKDDDVKYQQKVGEEETVGSTNPFWDMSPEQFMMMSSPPSTTFDNSMDRVEAPLSRSHQEENTTPEVLEPVSSPSAAKSESSSASSPKLLSNALHPSASMEEDEDDSSETGYAWDGHMDDEDFWDIDRRRLSLDKCDELASQVSSQLSSLLSKFREDNSSIHTRTINP